MAILQPGEYPLWFQLTDEGPVLLESIEYARFSAPFIPWPLAPHFRFALAKEDEILMAINRGGFLKLATWRGEAAGLGMYYFSGGAFWRQYTVGAFFFYDDKPAALLYLDDRFLDAGSPLPHPRTWTFRMESSVPHPLIIPALELFPADDGWDADSLHLGADGYWYYRVSKRTGQNPSVLMLRTADLAQHGEEISPGVFQNSALGEPLSAAPPPLMNLLSAAFASTGSDSALVISADFSQPRYFSENSGAGTALLVYYRADGEKTFALAILPTGSGFYITAGSGPEPFSLPPLPGGYVYTWIGMIEDSLFASWEEQEEYNIGAAGFMVFKMLVNNTN